MARAQTESEEIQDTGSSESESLSGGVPPPFDVRKEPFLSLAVMAMILVTAATISIGLYSVV